MTRLATQADILGFWFDEIDPKQQFMKDPDFDAMIKRRFGATVKAAINGDLTSWADTSDGCLAVILCLDQFARNIYRDDPKSFQGDPIAIGLSQKCVSDGFIKTAKKEHRTFMLMPMMHAEDIAIQDASLPLFQEYSNDNTYTFAIKHRDIIAQFGRFPHRNKILGRDSTKPEIEFLTKPGSSF